jgi:hypothetical protein
MNFRRELVEGIVQKYQTAAENLIAQGVNPDLFQHGGCLPMAIDGFVRGALPQPAYEGHLQAIAEGRVFSKLLLVEVLSGTCHIIRDALGDKCPPGAGTLKCFSSSPLLIPGTDIIPKPLSRQTALNLAADLGGSRTLGVFIVSEAGGRGHVFSLVGFDGAIYRVDAAAREVATCVSKRQAANLLRQGQRHGGLVIDVR